MPNKSRQVTSAQLLIHPRLESLLQKNLNSEYLRPIAQHNDDAMKLVISFLERRQGKEIILDAGCGTGLSSILLAKKYPEALILGIDRSLARLSKEKGDIPHNLLFLRADLEDLFRLFIHHNLHFEKIYFLYPNPYPKSTHLNQRWHGHALFRKILNHTKEIELRTNWELYIDEFIFACHFYGFNKTEKEKITAELDVTTLFERKYLKSEHLLFKASLKLL